MNNKAELMSQLRIDRDDESRNTHKWHDSRKWLSMLSAMRPSLRK